MKIILDELLKLTYNIKYMIDESYFSNNFYKNDFSVGPKQNNPLDLYSSYINLIFILYNSTCFINCFDFYTIFCT